MRPRWVEVSGGALKGCYLHIDPSVHWMGAMARGEYDPYIYQCLEGTDLTGCVAWDVGAHIGYHTLSFAVLVGATGQVHAFEPVPYNSNRIFRHLERNSELKSRVRIHEFPLADCQGSAVLRYDPRGADGGTAMGAYLTTAKPPRNGGQPKFKPLKVNTTSGDILIAKGRVPRPDIIKVDVEGAEGLVLRGMVGLLAAQHPAHLFIEIHNVTAMFDVMDVLYTCGYAPVLMHAASVSRCFLHAEVKLC